MAAVNYDWDELEDNLDEEYDDVGNTLAAYTTAPERFGNVISQRRDGESRFLHGDGLGSTLALTNAAGTVTDTYAYSAFGEVTEQTGSTTNPWLYVGQKGYYWDAETGDFSILRAPYQPIAGRWLAEINAGLAIKGDTTVYAFHAMHLMHGDMLTLFDFAVQSALAQSAASSPSSAGPSLCFAAGNALLQQPCKDRGLRPYGKLCYTPDDAYFCVKHLYFYAWGGATFWNIFVPRKCAGLLLYNFLDQHKKIDPYCPIECSLEIENSQWFSEMTQLLGMRVFRWPLPCNSKGSGRSYLEYGGPCKDPFLGVPNTFDKDLAISIGAVDSAKFAMRASYDCNAHQYTPCCCLCNVSFDVSYIVTDTYDFISTVSNREKPRGLVWCAAILEDLYKRAESKGKQGKLGQTFTTRCSGTKKQTGQGLCNGFHSLVIQPA